MLGNVQRMMCALSLLVGGVCLAQASVALASNPWPSDDLAQVRLRYGVTVRNGTEADTGPGLSYSGLSPNDFALNGWLWFLAGDHLGLTFGLQREGFSLINTVDNVRVASGSLLRGSVGPTGRIRLGPLRLEAAASYLFQQLPVFGTVAAPSFSTVQRHGILLAARGLAELGPVTLEGRFEYPLTLASVGRQVRSDGWGVGGGLRVQLFKTRVELFGTGFVKWGLLADVQWHQDSMSSTDSASPLATSQSVFRAGLALDLQWKDPRQDPELRTSRLNVRVRGESGPLGGAVVALTGPSGRRQAVTGVDGTASLGELDPGELLASASLEGYEAAESQVKLVGGDEVEVELVLNKEKPKVGGLAIKVVSFEGGTPVEATVDVNGVSSQTSPSGLLTLEGLTPGAISVTATAGGFNRGQEGVSVVAGRISELTITLVPETKRLPATLSGQVRSARGGKPVVAQLDIRELKEIINADRNGSFALKLPGGTYTISISATGFVTQTKTITVPDGDQVIFNVDLAPK